MIDLFVYSTYFSTRLSSIKRWKIPNAVSGRPRTTGSRFGISRGLNVAPEAITGGSFGRYVPPGSVVSYFVPGISDLGGIGAKQTVNIT